MDRLEGKVIRTHLMSKLHSSFSISGKSFSSVENLIRSLEDQSQKNFLSQWFDESQYVTVQTSGSTGIPKELSLPKDAMRASALATGQFFNLGPGSKVWINLSADYIAGKMMWVRALELGWEVYLNCSKGLFFDFTALVPLQVYKMNEEQLNQFDQILIGGGVFRTAYLKQFKNLKAKIFSSYGMTETISHIAIQSLYPEFTNYYQCLKGVEIGSNDKSCLWIYANRLNSERIQTNDLVEIISESKFQWLGRFDNVINSGGVKLFPETLEKKYSAYTTENFFFSGEGDKKLGTRLILILEGDGEDRDPRDSDKVLFKELGFTDFEIPKRIYFLKKFIFTETKKIQRNKTLDLVYKKL